jgi:hypothetical protein
MRLADRQIRFIVPFWPSIRRRKVRLGGRRGSLHLQETALVAEGEILRFYYFNLELLFRRAVSEWTTITVPYSRIVSVRYYRRLVLRAVSVVVLLAALAESAWLMSWGVLEAAVATLMLTVILALLLGYLNARVRPAYGVVFRGKDGRPRLLAFAIRSKRLRKSFADTLAAHRAAAAQFRAPTPG